jgi:hypothetical protein
MAKNAQNLTIGLLHEILTAIINDDESAKNAPVSIQSFDGENWIESTNHCNIVLDMVLTKYGITIKEAVYCGDCGEELEEECGQSFCPSCNSIIDDEE